MIPYKLVKAISLVLVKGPIVPIIILDFLFENCLENRLRLPRALAIRETSPFNIVQLVNIALVLDCKFNFIFCQVRALL